eukprot:c25256_g1_i2 orf=117-2660(-)
MENAHLCLSLLSTQNLRSYEGDAFAVAWVDPDCKHFTVVDSAGGTHTDWNPELIFHLKEHQLQHYDRESVTVEIYTRSCLRHELLGSLSVPFTDFMTKSGGMPEEIYAIIDASGNTQGKVVLSARVDASSVVTESPPSINPENISVPRDMGEKVQLQYEDRATQSTEEGRTASLVQLVSEESSNLNPGTDRGSYSTSDQDSSMATGGLESSNDSPSIRSNGKTNNLVKRAATASQLIKSASQKLQDAGNGGLSNEIQTCSTTTHTRTDSLSSEAESPDIRQDDSSSKGTNHPLLQQASKARTNDSSPTNFRLRPSPQPAKQKNSTRCNSFPQQEGSKQQKQNLSLPNSCFELRHSHVSGSQEESTASSASVNVSSRPPPRRKAALRNKGSKDGRKFQKKVESADRNGVEDTEIQQRWSQKHGLSQHRRKAPGLKGSSFHGGVGRSAGTFKFQQAQRKQQAAPMHPSSPEPVLDKIHAGEQADVPQDMMLGLNPSSWEAKFPQQMADQSLGSSWVSGEQTNQPSPEQIEDSSELQNANHKSEIALPEMNSTHMQLQPAQSKLEVADSQIELSSVSREQLPPPRQGPQKQVGSSQAGRRISIGRSKSLHDNSTESLVASRVQQFESMIQSELQESHPRSKHLKKETSELIFPNRDKDPNDHSPLPIVQNTSSPELISDADQPTSEAYDPICCSLDSHKSVPGEYAKQVSIPQEIGNIRHDEAIVPAAPANKAGQDDQYSKLSNGQPPQESIEVSKISTSTPTDREEIIISPDPDQSFTIRTVDNRHNVITFRQQARNHNQTVQVRPQSDISFNQSGTSQSSDTRKASKGWWSCTCKLGRFCCACYTAEF